LKCETGLNGCLILPKYCGECGTENNNNSTFCRNCGKRLLRINTADSSKNSHSHESNNRNKILIIIIVILTIVLAVMSVYILYNSSDNNNLVVNNSSSLPVSDSLNNTSQSSKNLNVLSKTVYFTHDGTNSENIGHGDNIGLGHSLYEGQMEANTISISIWCSDGEYGRYYKITKATVYYENDNGKTITKTYSGEEIYKKVPTGYTPIKAVVYYEKK